ncbi:MAG: hypothetical protein JNK82_26680 [Myxococcaceae bacterium]|nr:hypothetical protein [Myxococcaceae bacterium]
MNRALLFVALSCCFASEALATNVRMDFTTPCGAGYPSTQATLPPRGRLMWDAPVRINPDCLPGDADRSVSSERWPALIDQGWTLGTIAIQNLVHPMADIRRSVSARTLPTYEQGWSTTTGIYLRVEGGAIDAASLPTPSPSVSQIEAATTASVNTVQAVSGGAGPSVYLINVKRLTEGPTGTFGPPNPDYLRLYPIVTSYDVIDGVPTLSATPVQGVPLQPNALYALVVTNRVRSGGAPLTRPASLTQLMVPRRPAGMAQYVWLQYRSALTALETGSRPGQYSPSAVNDIVGITVFATHSPTEGFNRAVASALQVRERDVTRPETLDGTLNFPFMLPNPDPASYFTLEESNSAEYPTNPGLDPWSRGLEGLNWGIPNSGPDYGTDVTGVTLPPGVPTQVDENGVRRLMHSGGVFNEFCVFKSTIQLPLYLPDLDNSATGGRWYTDPATEVPARLGESRAVRIFVTIPRKPMPAGGWPVVVFSRSGGGGDVPLVTRSPTNDVLRYRASPDDLGPAFGQPGAGPALHFARAGWAGVQVDNHVGGWRRERGVRKITHGAIDQYLWDWSWGTGGENGKLYDVFNLEKMRDNVREAGLDIAVVGALTLRYINEHPDLLDVRQCTIRGPLPGSPPPSPGPCALEDRPLVDLNGTSHQGLDALYTTTSVFGPNVGPGSYAAARANCGPAQPRNPSERMQFNLTRLAYMGNSNGAHIGPLVMSAVFPPTWPGGFGTTAGAPIFKYAILGGAQGSMLMNVLYKSLPSFEFPPEVDVLDTTFLANRYMTIRELVESRVMLNRPALGAHDPMLNAFQMSQNLGETQNYSRVVADRLVGASPAQTVLQFQGVLDHYIPPPVGNPANLALGLGLADRRLDTSEGEPSADSRLAAYDDRTGPQRWLDDRGPIHRGHDFSTFMPYHRLQSLAGWGSSAGAAAGSGLGQFTALPAVKKSLVVQHSNGELGLAPHGARYGIPDPWMCTEFADVWFYLFHMSQGLLELFSPRPWVPILPAVFHPWNGLFYGWVEPVWATMIGPVGGACFPMWEIYGANNYPAYPRQDGHELVFQSSQVKHQYQCFLESAATGVPRIVDTQREGQDYTTCFPPCAHAPSSTGAPLDPECDCRVGVVCTTPGFESCCSSTWSAACVAAAQSAASTCF